MILALAWSINFLCAPFAGLIAFIIWGVVMYDLEQRRLIWFLLLFIIPIITIGALIPDFIGWSFLILYCITIWIQLPLEDANRRKTLAILTFLLLPIVVIGALIYAGIFSDSINTFGDLASRYFGEGISQRSATRLRAEVINGVVSISALMMVLYFEFHQYKPKAVIITITVSALIVGYGLGSSLYMERNEFACTSISMILPVALIALRGNQST